MKTPLAILLFFIPLRLLAPQPYQCVVLRQSGLNPFENAFKAVCLVESNGNPQAYNHAEKATGIAQIRQVKLDDYNRHTGSSIKLEDCYCPEVSRQVFMWHMAQYDPANIDMAIRRWNGSGTATHEYLKKVKNVMKTETTTKANKL
jgi:hypothetical protein